MAYLKISKITIIFFSFFLLLLLKPLKAEALSQTYNLSGNSMQTIYLPGPVKVGKVNISACSDQNRNGGFQLGIALLYNGIKVAYKDTLHYARSGCPMWSYAGSAEGTALDFGGASADAIQIIPTLGSGSYYQMFVSYEAGAGPPPTQCGGNTIAEFFNFSGGNFKLPTPVKIHLVNLYACSVQNRGGGFQLAIALLRNAAQVAYRGTFLGGPGNVIAVARSGCPMWSYGQSPTQSALNFGGVLTDTISSRPIWGAGGIYRIFYTHEPAECSFTHKACQGNSCIVVSGAGADQCSSDAGCAPPVVHCIRCSNVYANQWVEFDSTDLTCATVVPASNSITRTCDCGCPSAGLDSSWNPGCAASCCTDTSWSPDLSTVCVGQAFTQTSNCGRTRTVTGTKPCCASGCGDWSSCSVSCGGGSQSQTCTRNDCSTYGQTQFCNTQACPPPPTVDFSVKYFVSGQIREDGLGERNTTITAAQGDEINLNWISTNADYCRAAENWASGNLPANDSGDNYKYTPQSLTTYTIKCYGPGGESQTESVTVNIIAPELTLEAGSLSCAAAEIKWRWNNPSFNDRFDNSKLYRVQSPDNVNCPASLGFYSQRNGLLPRPLYTPAVTFTDPGTFLSEKAYCYLVEAVRSSGSPVLAQKPLWVLPCSTLPQWREVIPR